MKKKRIIIVIVLIVLTIGAYTGIGYYKDLKSYKSQVESIEIKNVDFSKIPDGTYSGRHSVLLVSAEVKVIVKDNKITDIKLVEHVNGKGTTAEIIPSKVVEAQSLNVDIVSGATSSSKVILKAIENALNIANK